MIEIMKLKDGGSGIATAMHDTIANHAPSSKPTGEQEAI